MSKGKEVGEVVELIGADRTQVKTLILRVRSVVDQWRGLGFDDRTLEALLTRRGEGESGHC